eukprot:745776-Hanusia_phi.AAC.1
MLRGEGEEAGEEAEAKGGLRPRKLGGKWGILADKTRRGKITLCARRRRRKRTRDCCRREQMHER